MQPGMVSKQIVQPSPPTSRFTPKVRGLERVRRVTANRGPERGNLFRVRNVDQVWAGWSGWKGVGEVNKRRPVFAGG